MRGGVGAGIGAGLEIPCDAFVAGDEEGTTPKALLGANPEVPDDALCAGVAVWKEGTLPNVLADGADDFPNRSPLEIAGGPGENIGAAGFPKAGGSDGVAPNGC
jgi:hypothetical protein